MKSLIETFTAAYINGESNTGIIDNALLVELKNYGNRRSPAESGRKALRLWIKCYRADKKELASRIEAKYGHLFPKSDASIALGWAIHRLQ